MSNWIDECEAGKFACPECGVLVPFGTKECPECSEDFRRYVPKRAWLRAVFKVGETRLAVTVGEDHGFEWLEFWADGQRRHSARRPKGSDWFVHRGVRVNCRWVWRPPDPGDIRALIFKTRNGTAAAGDPRILKWLRWGIVPPGFRIWAVLLLIAIAMVILGVELFKGWPG